MPERHEPDEDFEVDVLLDKLLNGDLDEHLEAILAAGHARKRQRRGVRRASGLPRV